MISKKSGSAGGSKKKELPIYRIPGKEQLQGFLRENKDLFNFSEIERISQIPQSTLRYICAEKSVARTLREIDYQKLKTAILPKMCEFVLLLQNYT